MIEYSLQKENLNNYSIKSYKCYGKNSIDNAINKFNLNHKITKILSGNPWVIKNFKEKGFEILENPFKINFSSKKIRESMLNENLSWHIIAASGTIFLEKELDLINKIKKYNKPNLLN